MIPSIVTENETKIKSSADLSNQIIFRKRYRITIEEQTIIYEKSRENPEISSPALLLLIGKIEISISQLNRLRQEFGTNRKRGRPRKQEQISHPIAKTKTTQISANIGLCLFFLWLEKNDHYVPVLEAIGNKINEYKGKMPGEQFRLLNAGEKTIEKKWKALSLLPLLGIKKISEIDYCQHYLPSVLGEKYSSSTLTQFLGELERIDVGESFKLLLSSNADGEYCYIDGHLIAYWTSTKKMHKGLITMLGRIMPGSNAVLAHNEEGQAIGFDYYPPDIHLTHIVEEYCSNIVEVTEITNFVIDREVNSVDIARLFVEKEWDLICLLGSNEYKGLESFNKKFCKQLDDGTVLYKASWKEERDNDPRKFVIAQQENRAIVYWGTPKIVKILTAEQFICTYRNRAEVQENSIKKMIAHGALNTNYGTKTIAQPDRTHQRKLEKIEKKIEKSKIKIEKAKQKIAEQIPKVRESRLKGHGKRLEQRAEKLKQYREDKKQVQQKMKNVVAEKKKLGKRGTREDRDFRKQSLMTFRTLWMENLLCIFVALISDTLKIKAGIEVILHLFFRRAGIMEETTSHIVYTFNSDNLSLKYQEILQNLVDGFNNLSLNHRGKQVVARVTGFT